MFDVCVIGHAVRDINTIGGTTYAPSAGGTAVYSAIAYASLGLRTAVVTKVAEADAGLLLDGLRAAGVEVFNLPTEETTAFRNYYFSGSPDLRMQHVDARAGMIGLAELPGVAARVFHIGPLTADDIDPAIIARCSHTGARVVLDAQGFTRDVVGGRVVPRAAQGNRDFLAHVDILQADGDEIVVFTGAGSIPEAAGRALAEGAGRVLVTLASRGSMVFERDEVLRISALPPRHEADATGCGDTYLAAYVSRWILGESASDCADFASVAASLNIETLGPFCGTVGDVLARRAEASGAPTSADEGDEDEADADDPHASQRKD